MKLFLTLFVLFSTYTFAQTETYEITNLDMNDESSHMGLFFNQSDEVFFSSAILDKINISRKKRKKHLIYSLFVGRRNSNGQIVDIKKSDKANLNYLSSSSAVVSPNGKYIYITTNRKNKKDTYKLKSKSFNLYIARGEFINGHGWSNFKRLPFCKPTNSYGHPAISPDGRTLYFISNEPSAKGASDIFKVDILGENEYSKPKNLGSLVNSVRKEMFPFMSEDGVLYFSSDRSGGFGQLDVYSSRLDKNNDFDKARLLSKPINSNRDDFSYVIDKKNSEGYFTSNRAGGKGDDDIYYFKIINEVKTDELEPN